VISRIFIPGFGLVALIGALLATGRLAGDGGVQTAFGITLLVIGVLGVFNVIFFRRLKAAVDRMADEAKNGGGGR